MNILFCTHRFYPDIGGIEVNSEILANEFINAGYNVKLITWSEDHGETQFPYEVIRKPSIMALIRQYFWAHVIFENNPCLRLSWPNIFFKKPLVVAIRTWISRADNRMKWQDYLKLFWIKKANKIIAVSEAIKQRYTNKSIVIGNPYRIQKFYVDDNVVRSDNIIFLGRLVSDKGVDVAIKAFYKLQSVQKYNHVKLTIVGDGPERIKLEDMVRKLGLEKHIDFIGALKGRKLNTVLNLHKIIVVPSVWQEPFGNVALEGMACGCIPIVSDGGGLPDAVGEAGLIFERANVDSLTEKLMSILSNQKLVDDLLKAAKIHLRNHRPDTIANKYLNVIKHAAKQ